MDRVCGLDVHKDSIFMCILTESGEKAEAVFGTSTPELDRLRDVLVERGVGKVAMESTSIYWLPVWRVLSSDFELKLVNPYFIRQLPGRKSDVKDAHWIALVLQKELIRDSFVPGPEIQQMRQYNRRRFALTRNLQRAEQAQDMVLQRCNIRLSNYVTDIGGKSMKKVLNALSQGETDTDKLVAMVHRRIINKHGKEAIRASLIGIISCADREMLCMCLEETALYEGQKKLCEEKLVQLCKQYYPQELELLQSVPGIKQLSAACIISETGADMSYFQNAASLVGWTGLRPRNDESAGKIKGRKTLHGNKYLRIMLIQCAWGASRTKSSTFFIRYNNLKKRMNHNKALMANARKLLVVIWNILAKKQGYLPYAA
jgi:transposase